MAFDERALLSILININIFMCCIVRVEDLVEYPIHTFMENNGALHRCVTSLVTCSNSMLFDADEFCPDVLDTSYGSAQSSNRKRKYRNRVKGSTHDENGGTGNSEASTDVNSDPPSVPTFLRAELNPCSTPSFLEETVIRAGCSSDALGIARSMGAGPSGLDCLTSKMTASDAALISAQLDLERRTEWQPSSLFSRLGVDESGLYGTMKWNAGRQQQDFRP
ncbi:hypothetical protein Y032_0037g3496 [Ancylostoma ceylanicum]|uniref:Uncharacterized protein n=1 Tax=Ancylostoma ceylanicum TaxID=53326 RepID=A0A016UJK6_9BILA|nr:hypothetical protein Y032_0037g3496 [Ancylostoma ceylanicum]